MATFCALSSCLFDNKNWSRVLVYLFNGSMQCIHSSHRLIFYKSVYEFGQALQMIILDILLNPVTGIEFQEWLQVTSILLIFQALQIQPQYCWVQTVMQQSFLIKIYHTKH